MNDLPSVAQRFLHYVAIDTTANPESSTVPSSPGQLELGRILRDELIAVAASEVHHDSNGYVYATVPASPGYQGPVIGLVAHLDTSPDAPGNSVRPIVRPPYDGSVLTFPADSYLTLGPREHPALLDHIGHRLITSDGSTLLGSDDKAGVAIVMQLVADLNRSPTPRPELRICFTVDEEIGKGIDYLDVDRFDPQVAYTIDGSGRDVIYAETFNAASLVVRINGRAVHPGYAKGLMINAIQLASSLVGRIPLRERPETTSGRAGYYHVHTLGPADVSHAEMRIIVRDFERGGLEARIDQVRTWATEIEALHPGSQVSVAVMHEYSNMRDAITHLDPRVMEVAQEAAHAMGVRLTSEPVRGGTDGARLSERGIPTPNIFNGGHDYHSVLEWNSVENLEHSLAYLKSLMACWAARCGRPTTN
jgi:tripeptide aminopeptidase